ncbi:MAG: lysophospholipid acyltransferase family protein [Planctomycetota bacterium]
MQRGSENDIKRPAAWLQNGFHRFLGPFLKRHFHAIAVETTSREDRSLPADAPLVVYANHPSWWDPLIAHFLNRTLFPSRQFYAPIDAEALQQYRVFERLGFFGVQLDNRAGAAAFLSQSRSILSQSETALWITPEGRFADIRDHDAAFQPGLAHLCSKSDSLVALPVALEYVFWEERLPVCLVAIGQAQITADAPDRSKADWTCCLTRALRDAQNRLAERSVSRDSTCFENLLQGKRGGGGMYDSFRRLKALMTGRSFKAAHGEHFE